MNTCKAILKVMKKIFFFSDTMATANVPSVSKKTLSTISVFDKNTVDIKVSHSSKNTTVTYDNQTTNTGSYQFAEKSAGKIKGMISDLELMWWTKNIDEHVC